jgi:predicted metal-dependent HD superfamily phosphohydrolase
MLEKRFKRLCQNYTNDNKLIAQLWQEIVEKYSQPTRSYHTLTHLEAIFQALKAYEITPLLAFATFYHDIVYDVLQDDNEKHSADLAQKRLEQLNVFQKLTQKVAQLILETQTHYASSDENQLFLDADLAILGSNEAVYRDYTQQIRTEYALYDEVSYFEGRKKVLKMFLEREKIYKTPYFYEKYEKEARVNLLREYNIILNIQN